MYKKISLITFLLTISAIALSQKEESLKIAIQKQDKDKCASLIAQKADVSFVYHWDDCGCTPLHFAIPTGCESICALLIAAKADIEKMDYGSRASLCCAVTAGNYSICKLLLESNAEVNKYESSMLHRNLLKCAVDASRINSAYKDIGSLLLEFGADPGVVAKDSGFGDGEWGKAYAIKVHQDTINFSQQFKSIAKSENKEKK